MLVTTLSFACAGPPAQPARRAEPSYDNFSRKLIVLAADQNGDGTVDQWTYLDGNRPLRGEADADGDGRIDRWEYFNAEGTLTAIGTSSANDGNEDTWTDVVKTRDGLTHVARSSRRDHVADRHEYFRGDALVQVDEDTNHDGRTDKWTHYEGTALREVDFDTSFTTGRPNRRALYDAQGKFVAVEINPTGDGTWLRTNEPLETPK